MHIKDKVCVVTGGASGIGEATARAFADAGARGVVVADLKTNRDKLAQVAGDIDGLAVAADVGEEAATYRDPAEPGKPDNDEKQADRQHRLVAELGDELRGDPGRGHDHQRQRQVGEPGVDRAVAEHLLHI